MAEFPAPQGFASGSLTPGALDGVAAQAKRLQRMEIVGALAGSFAHEFNNLLLAIRGNLDLALMAPDISEAVAARLNQAQTATARASELSQRLMALAKPAAEKPDTIDFNQVAQEAVTLTGRVWRGKIAVTCQPAAGPLVVWMDFASAVQGVLSLCLNAGEALLARSGNGRITVSTESVLRGQPFVCCTVADNGPGISPEVIAGLFAPFFTTKPQGTGAGLAVAQLIVRHAGGVIEAENLPAGGAAFRILVPHRAPPEKSA